MTETILKIVKHNFIRLSSVTFVESFVIRYRNTHRIYYYGAVMFQVNQLSVYGNESKTNHYF